MDAYEVIGWVGAALMVSTFAMKRMTPLRVVAVCANVAMITYAWGLQIYPVLALQTCLLPINVFRLSQLLEIGRSLKDSGNNSLAALAPHLRTTHVAAGEVLFRIGDHSDQMYIVESGEILLEELQKTVHPGELLGELGVFADQQKRSGTAIATTDVELRTIPAETVRQLCLQHPDVGLALLRMVLERIPHGAPNEPIIG